MRALRQLASQTAIYGLSTVAVRLLNYLLVPFHTRIFTEQADYGIISELYAWVAFLNVVFMYGMETAFFRYASKKENDQPNHGKLVFKTSFGALLISTAVLVGAILAGSGSIADWMNYPDQREFITWFALIIGFDTLANIPFARLRLNAKPLQYAGVKLLNVVVNVGLNFFFLLPLVQSDAAIITGLQSAIASTGFTYDPTIGVGYVFLANLIASAASLSVLLPGTLRQGIGIDQQLLGKMLRYGAPFIIAGLAGMVNETIDRILLIKMLPGDLDANRAQVGIYSAAYKLSIFMTLGVQAFRMGAEPFFFKTAADEGEGKLTAAEGQRNSKAIYAAVMKYFVIIGSLIFLSISLFLPELKRIIGPAYWAGIGVVPILLLANLCLGIFYNLSVWYKLTDKTSYAMLLAIIGAGITLLLNYLLIPTIGYWGSAWATLAAYGAMAVMSWLLGRKHFDVPYDLARIGGYLAGSIVTYLLVESLDAHWLLRLGSILLFTSLVYIVEKRQNKASTNP